VFPEFAITLADATVWSSIAQGLLIGAVCLLFGVWVARFVGLLRSDAPAGETLGVGLASGLVVLVAWWAAIASGGRSSFTPVAVGFALAIGLAAVRRRHQAADTQRTTDGSADVAAGSDTPGSTRFRDLLLAVAGGAVFFVAVALLYGSTMGPRPRDGVQPIEFADETYYAVLGADLARTGTESLFAPSGLTQVEGLPAQTWYHWGEAWLGSAAITIFGTGPLDARLLIVLPVMLLAAATMTGTLVRRMTRSRSRGPFLFGFSACLFLAPVPLAVGMIFEVRMYPLAAVAVLLAMYGLAVLDGRRASWALACFVGSAAALLLPAHIVIAALAVVGIGSVWATRIGQSLIATRRLPEVAPVWQQTYVATGIALVATVIWGVLTGHGLGASGVSPEVSSFNAFWRETVATIVICSGACLAIVIAWFMIRKQASIESGLYLGTIALLVVGTAVWGARLGDFNTFHLFYGGLAVFGTPVAAVAVWSIWLRLRATGRVRLAIALLVVCGTQLEFGALFGIGRLGLFGPGDHATVPMTILAAIRNLPPDAKLAYACRPAEESAFWNSQLLGLDVHTGRRVVPMCFESETTGLMSGTPVSPDIASPMFQWAPQRALYPDSRAQPSPAVVAAFMRVNGIDYIYVDRVHPNTLVPGAIPVATDGQTQVLRLP
jgi:hypothetical protein